MICFHKKKKKHGKLSPQIFTANSPDKFMWQTPTANYLSK